MSDDVSAARAFAAKPYRLLVAELRSGAIKANDTVAWIADLERDIRDIDSGRADHVFSVWQRMHLYRTGQCVPLLTPAPPAVDPTPVVQTAAGRRQLELL